MPRDTRAKVRMPCHSASARLDRMHRLGWDVRGFAGRPQNLKGPSMRCLPHLFCRPVVAPLCIVAGSIDIAWRPKGGARSGVPPARRHRPVWSRKQVLLAGPRRLCLRLRLLPGNHVFRGNRIPGSFGGLRPGPRPAALRVRHDRARSGARSQHAFLIPAAPLWFRPSLPLPAQEVFWASVQSPCAGSQRGVL
jgi:hypothetical protein